ncbi:MAG: PTS sugar transporter subunit IIA, partial [Planctomycetes bacterium]|nr:PTS sugar transporter subunit IIA [Planctomycetota bacterium]
MLRILGVVGSGFMKITNILSKACACVSLTAKDKSAAITELVDLLNADGRLSDRDAALQAVLAREQTRSTGIGLGLAVPQGEARAC